MQRISMRINRSRNGDLNGPSQPLCTASTRTSRLRILDICKALSPLSLVEISCALSALHHTPSNLTISRHGKMKLTNHSAVLVYTISGSSTARPLPEWLARKRKRSLKNDPEYANRIELLQDFEFEEASQCIRVSDDGDWVMSTGAFTQSLIKSPLTTSRRNIQAPNTYSLPTPSLTVLCEAHYITQHNLPASSYRLYEICTSAG